ncbi:MAG TPA: peptidoglycan-binding protein [Bacillales bacterium]|nr:peptidoglycan-binding protein [Bacillales bacterium]
MRKPKNQTVKTFVTTTAFASMVLAAPAISYADLGDKPLKQGMKDPDVRQLQDLLKEKGYFHFPRSTGYFGPITKEAVIQFQKDHSLKTTGVVKGRTFQKLGVQSVNRVSTNRLLRVGSRGEAVSELQTKLKKAGTYEGSIDGLYGPLTAAAVRKFQRSRGLTVDGIAGPVTLGALYKHGAREREQAAKKSRNEQKKTQEVKKPDKGSSFTKQVLRVGSRGKAVSSLQNHLQAAGLYTYTVDGIYGSRTAAAVRKFQRAHGLKVDGIAGPVTLSTLYGSKEKAVEPEKEKQQEKKVTEPNLQQENDGLLNFRDRGAYVTDLQKKLAKIGLLDQSPSGYYGMDTEQAVREFQAKYGLTVDGIVGPNTRAKLTEVLGSKEKAKAPAEENSSFSVMNLVADAADLLGTPYQWGGEVPSTGFDCSGFVQYLFAENGIDLPRTVAWMWNTNFGHKVDNLQPGDVVFFEGTYKNGPSHNGVYIGNGQFIQSGSSNGVTVSDLDYQYWSSHYLGAKRFF